MLALKKGTFSSFLLLAFCLAITIFAACFMKYRIDIAAKLNFSFKNEEIKTKISERLVDQVQLLYSGAGIFHASPKVTRKEWQNFINLHDPERTFLGVQGIGFSLAIPASELAAHEQMVRAEGFSNYNVKPIGTRQFYTSIIYLEPFSGLNLRAFGYDMFSQPVRREAMERARDNNKAALSGKVVLVQESGTEVQAGVLIYVPVYRVNMPLDTLDQRRVALYGWVYSPYRMGDLIRGILKDANIARDKNRAVAIFDGDSSDYKTLLYDAHAGMHTNSKYTIRFSEQIPLNLYGHRWTLRFTEHTASLFSADYLLVWSILASGTLVSFGIFALFYFLLVSRKKAIDLSNKLSLARDDANKANAAKSQFLANMSHEIRSPMNGIIGLGELLAMSKLTPTQKEMVENIQISGDNLLRIINDILDISKIEAGKIEVDLQVFSLKKMLDLVLALILYNARKKNLEIKSIIDQNIPDLLISDEGKIRQILINLTSNAVKFTERGMVSIEVKKISEAENKLELEFSVTDTGIGIPENFRKNIFKAFEQGDTHNGYTKKYAGTGLGLAICKSLITLLGGEIDFKSKQNTGTKFFFTLVATKN